jgi:hemerythrin-like metal-binding protein
MDLIRLIKKIRTGVFKMALINWSEKYTVKVERFDEAHKKLIQYINDLFELLKSKAGNDQIQLILDSLEDYTKTHFSEEEREMQKTEYPDYPAHRQKHIKLIEELDALRSKKDIDSGLLNTQVLYFLKDWLTSHIMEVDQKYSDHMNAHGVN